MTRLLADIIADLEDVADHSDGDPEVAHSQADALLLEAIEGAVPPREFQRLSVAWDHVRKWYA